MTQKMEKKDISEIHPLTLKWRNIYFYWTFYSHTILKTDKCEDKIAKRTAPFEFQRCGSYVNT